jgi:beta-N-acetylhexosaminidase
VIPTAKHFPGVGSVSDDPHKKTVENKVSAQTLFDRDLKPFEDFAKLGPNTAIMLSHLVYPSLDPTKTPATLSPHIIKDILRTQFGYTGLVITDDIQMKGLANVSNPHEAALKALQAGADVIMMTWSFKDQAKAIERVKKAVATGELSMEDLNEKVSRILAVKDFIQKNSPRLGEISNPKVVALSTKKLREIESKILDFNIQVALRNAGNNERSPSAIAKLKKAAAPVCVFSPNVDFIESFKKSNPTVTGVKITSKTKTQMLTNYIKKKSCPYAVFVIHGPKTAGLLERLPTELAKKMLIINLSSPRLIADTDKFLNVVNLYFPHPEAGKRVAENLRALARRNSIRNFAHTELE